MLYPQLVHALESPCGSTEPSALCLACISVMVSGSGFKVEASVVVMLYLCPVGDPILFLWLLRLKSQIELIALSLANFHPLVLWHYTVVEGSLKESKLEGKRREGGDIKEDAIKWKDCWDIWRLRRGFRIQRLRKIRLGNRETHNILLSKTEKMDKSVKTKVVGK